MNIPVVVVATFYSGMPPEQIEGDITYHLERFFTLASGIDHIESRSLNGVSIIHVYFQPDTNADIDAATIANLAVADMRDLPPGTLPPVVLKFDASSLPVCLVTLNGEGMTDGNLKDIAQNFVRNQLAGVPGASIPQPFGGPWRQILFYVDPYKLEARQISPMDVVRALNQANVILPAGDVQIGNLDYNIYANASSICKDADQYPIKMNGENPGADVGHRAAQGRPRAAIQRGARGRPALGLSAGDEAGRRFQHHRGGGRRSQDGEPPGGRSAGHEDRTWCSISRGSCEPPSRRCCTKAASACS